MSEIFNTGAEMIDVQGYRVERDVLRVIEAIRNYDPNLEVFYFDPSRPGTGDFASAPWVVAERCKDGQFRRVFDVWSLDDRVLDRIRMADTYNNDIMAKMDAANSLARLFAERRFEEPRAIAKDQVEHIIKSPKGTYTFKNDQDEIVKISEGDETKKLPSRLTKDKK